ncbi:GspE/PulE family protein [Yoonia sp. 2307UL14-13]|uniref:GspE/PulE family protein n=1 Tax=Yoonia sp. 2307UL14-13 TaxID=3126506 RepID=UPI0030A363FB
MARVLTVHVDDIEIPARFLQDGTLASNDVIKARQVSASTGQPVRVVLDRLGIISQSRWAETVAEANNLPLIALDDFPERLPRDDRLSMEYMKRNSVALLSLTEDDVPRIAIANPMAQQVRQALRMIFGARIDFTVATDRDIEAALDRSEALGEETNEEGDALDDVIALADGEIDTDRLTELANNAPTVKYLDGLFSKAVERNATDIHIEALEKGPRVRLRIDGILVETAAVERHLYEGVVSRLKILAGMDISERRLPQDGRIRQKASGRSIDVRVASAPTVHGETLVLRLLDNSQQRARLDLLAMPNAARERLETALDQPNGLILVTGPTGSGKTTTLHAALAELNETGRKIITIENPVEIQTPGLIQIDIKPELGWTFASALRSVLRHDPDVLMVGEIRDAETAELAVRAALTGHLVLSTLHTNRAAEAVLRLGDMGVPDYLLKSVLRLVGAQRLVRTLCDHCAEPVDLTVNPSYASLAETFLKADPSLGHPDTWAPHVAKGCSHCNNTGYSGRMALFEMMSEGEALAAASGQRPRYRTMGLEGLGLFTRGQTTLNELVRVFGAGEFWV